MKSGAEKSSTTTSPAATQEGKQPFFTKVGEGCFFAPVTATAAPAVQMKMEVSKPGDRSEQEAEDMAARVMRMPAPASPAQEEKLQRQGDDKLQKSALPEEKIQKAASPEEKIQKVAGPEEKIQKAAVPDEKIQKAASSEEMIKKAASSEDKIQKTALPEEKIRKAGKAGDKVQRQGSEAAPAVSREMQSAIRDKAIGGQPLPSEVRNYMEPRFAADFSKVRVHNDSESAGLSDQLRARAFTYQNHIFFSKDQYKPGTDDGKTLLAHELSHTLQQSSAVRKAGASAGEKRDEVISKAPKKAVAAKPAVLSSEVVDLSTGVFNPSEKVKEEIAAQKYKGLDVRVIVKGVTGEGLVKIKVDPKKNYDSIGKHGSMPLLSPWTQELGGMYLNFRVVNSEIKKGFASFKEGGGDPNDWLETIRKNSALLGGVGLKIQNLPRPINKFEGGRWTLGVSKPLKVEVAGVFDAELNIAVENADKPKIDATAEINVKGIVKGQLKIDNSKEKLAGQVSLAVEYKSFSGTAIIKYNPDGTVDIGGKASYNADRLSGQVEFIATDLETANRFAKDAIAAAGGKENVQEAPPPGPVPAPKTNQKKRALAATGQLEFHLTTWFAGTVFVVVDGNGHITVIGKIAPPGEIELFKQKDWDKEIIEFEAKAYYGIPVVGNLNLFANISLHAIAKLGPAKLYKIEILGTYSTDPEIQKFIQISGSINVSAYGGLRLRAEGGAGVEIASHDLKFGIGLQADVGVAAYAEARPTIGYRDPGVFYISGTLDIVAQPMLGLGGDFFIKLETPWWSPLSDDKWTWPLFSKEWPLGDPIGISAAVKEYELGSKKVPEIELKKPEFDPAKMMTKMVDDDLPNKSGKKGDGQGSFKEDGTVPKHEVPPKKPEPKKADAKGAKKGAQPKGGKSGTPDPKAAKEQQSGKIFQAASKPLAALKGKGPFGRAELNQELGKIKAQVSGINFTVQAKGDKWLVAPKAGGRTGKGIELKGKPQEMDGALDGAVDSAAAALNWSFAKMTFTEADGQRHTLFFEGGDNPRLIIQSDPKAAKAFLDWYLSKKRKTFKKKHDATIKDIRTHIDKAQSLANSIADLKKKGVAWKAKQQELLQVNVELSAALSKLLGDDRAIADAIEKYKLEGMTGTYGSIPKPPGDDFTADHQPQAAILTALAKFRFFSKDGTLQERAEGRAAKGYAINLHKTRHMAGATYGTKGKDTKDSFLRRVKPAVKDKPAEEQRSAVIALVKADLSRDVEVMKSVVDTKYNKPIWEDVMDAADNDKAGQLLVSDIRNRIKNGQDQIEHQDLELD